MRRLYALTVTPKDSLTGATGSSAYSASKAALGAFFDCLREELRGSGVSVLMAYPSEVSSRFAEHAYQTHSGSEAAYSGANALSVSDSAARILRGLEKNQSRIMLRFSDRLTQWLYLTAPGLCARLRPLLRRPSAAQLGHDNSLNPNI